MAGIWVGPESGTDGDVTSGGAAAVGTLLTLNSLNVCMNWFNKSDKDFSSSRCDASLIVSWRSSTCLLSVVKSWMPLFRKFCVEEDAFQERLLVMPLPLMRPNTSLGLSSSFSWNSPKSQLDVDYKNIIFKYFYK